MVAWSNSGCLRGLLTLIVALSGVSSCTWQADDEGGKPAAPDTVGDRQHGREVIGRVGCGSCHKIPGIGQAEGRCGDEAGAGGVEAVAEEA